MAGATVLDASALIALFESEPGAGRVASLLPTATISSVNLAEVLEHDSARRAAGGSAAGIAGLGVTVAPFTAAQAERAARMRPETRAAGLSLADRACLALAIELDAGAVTADRAWAEVDVGVKVKLVR